MVDIAFGLTIIASIFAIVDPIGVVPFFAMWTEGMSAEQKKDVITKSCLVSLTTLGVFAIFGQGIFALFNFTIPAFKIAGGLLLFGIAFEMLHGQRPRTKMTDKEHDEAIESEAIGIVPLGIPLLAGPGAITTVIIYMARPVGDPLDKMFVFLGIFITVIVTFYLLRSSDAVFRRFGRGGTLAVGRIFGLFLAAIAIQFVIDGIVSAYAAARASGALP